MPGIKEWLLILLVVLVIFGAGKLPKVMGDVAKGVKNFKSGMAEEVTDAAKETASSESSSAQVSESVENKDSSLKN